MTTEAQPIAALWEWQQDGLCRDASPDTFFHPDGERGPSRRWRDQRAVALCQRCPVIAQCREHALRVAEPYGVWGGMTEQERASELAARAAADSPRQRVG